MRIRKRQIVLSLIGVVVFAYYKVTLTPKSVVKQHVWIKPNHGFIDLLDQVRNTKETLTKHEATAGDAIHVVSNVSVSAKELNPHVNKAVSSKVSHIAPRGDTDNPMHIMNKHKGQQKDTQNKSRQMNKYHELYPEVPLAKVISYKLTPDTHYSTFHLNMRLQDGGNTHDVNLHDGLPLDVPFIHNEPMICRHKHIHVLFYISSGPGNFAERQFTRTTWAKEQSLNNMTFRAVFFVGLPQSQDIQLKLNEEIQEHRDVIQLGMIDSYKNLSYKGVAAITWMTNYCPDVEYVIKADDDLVVDIRHFADVISQQLLPETTSAAQGVEPKVVCLYLKGSLSTVHRMPGHKYYVPPYILPNMTAYPPICKGSFYGYPGFLLPKIHQAAIMTPFFWLEDIYVTSFILPQVNVQNIKYVNIIKTWEKMARFKGGNTNNAIKIFFDPGMKYAPRYWTAIQNRYK